MRVASLVAIALVAVGCRRAHDVEMRAVPLALDQEERLADQPLSSTTQSVNRYRSVLSRFDAVDLRYDARSGRLGLRFDDKGKPSDLVAYQAIDARFVVPLLPYAHERALSPFDKLNLMLAEYSRNGVELSLQDGNSEYGYATARALFNDDEEYRFAAGKVLPNPGARPKRMALVNNCLFPGLWELSASDSVGEMWHAWMTLPKHGYFELVRAVDGLDAGDDELADVLDYHKTIPRVAVELPRLRSVVRELGTFPVAVDADKALGSYSTQDSRRKVQRKFYRVERDGKEIAVSTFGDLRAGDRFQFFSFVPPGIYTKKTLRAVPYEPIWTAATLREVTPRTRFGAAPSPHPYAAGALELVLKSGDGKRAIVVGNLPIDLLVFQEDYDVPGFGVGVLRASEPIEKRHLFLRDGPAPIYAYAADVDGDALVVANNHELGLEQIYLRPYQRGGEVVLRVTLVAYERIVDILELDVKLPDELARKVVDASAHYQRPLWRSFSDSNLL
ncbi:MAG: hypothetical protein JWM53_3798 [bacterium]|nr:hypothetical protein [bacterium]